VSDACADPAGAGGELVEALTAPALHVAPGGPRLLEAVLRFESAHKRRSAEAMRACFHDDALIESVASDGQPLGASETVAAILLAFGDGVYVIDDWRYEEIALDKVLAWTRARRRRRTGDMSDAPVYRAMLGRDGLMWRVTLFESREAALAYLGHGASPRGFAAGG
jgi:hypothetical protein